MSDVKLWRCARGLSGPTDATRTGGGRGRKGTGLTYEVTISPVRYATSLSVLDKVDEGVSLSDLRTDC